MTNIGRSKKEDVECQFNLTSIDLKLRNFKGKNYRLILDPLYDWIIPEECKAEMRVNSIVLLIMK